MRPDNDQQPTEQSHFKPKRSFDAYRLKHGPEHRSYKTIDDPVSHKVSNRRRAQIILAVLAFCFAIAVTYFITKHT